MSKHHAGSGEPDKPGRWAAFLPAGQARAAEAGVLAVSAGLILATLGVMASEHQPGQLLLPALLVLCAAWLLVQKVWSLQPGKRKGGIEPIVAFAGIAFLIVTASVVGASLWVMQHADADAASSVQSGAHAQPSRA